MAVEMMGLPALERLPTTLTRRARISLNCFRSDCISTFDLNILHSMSNTNAPNFTLRSRSNYQYNHTAMNIDGYLQRINYTQFVRPDVNTLHGLQRAHMQSIPFENLDIGLKQIG